MDLTEKHENQVNEAIDELQKQNLISQNYGKYLIAEHSQTPKFYMLPKIHKKNNPGRPVISSMNCHTTNISEFVDKHLHPHVK